MFLVEILNYDGRYETIRADQIESVVKPDRNRVHDYGAVILVGGRRIALGHVDGQCDRVIRELKEA